jgi:23S rRNA U2552 (ribose-2'-O)-methylase RlmE/FtsJ
MTTMTQVFKSFSSTKQAQVIEAVRRLFGDAAAQKLAQSRTQP